MLVDDLYGTAAPLTFVSGTTGLAVTPSLQSAGRVIVKGTPWTSSATCASVSSGQPG